MRVTIIPDVDDGILIQFSDPRKGKVAVSIPSIDIIAQAQIIISIYGKSGISCISIGRILFISFIPKYLRSF